MCTIGLSLALTSFKGTQKTPFIEVKDLKKNYTLASIDLDVSRNFTRIYLHSVCKDYVEEFYVVNDDDNIVLSRIKCKNFSVLDYYSAVDGELIEENDTIYVSNINLVLGKSLTLLVSSDSRSILEIGDLILPLYLIVEDGTVVQIAVFS